MMNDEENTVYEEYPEGYHGEELSRELERDARRYNKAFTEEEEVRLI